MQTCRALRAAVASALLVAAIPAAVQAAAAEKPSVLRLYPHLAEDCDGRWLDTRKGEEYGCFFLFQPASEVFHQTDQPIYADYATSRHVVALDAQKDVRGTVNLDHLVGRGVGVDTVDVMVTAEHKNGKEVLIGSASVTQPANALGYTPFPFSIDVPAALHGVALHNLNVHIEVRSLSAPHAGVRHDGSSFIDLPIARPRR